MKKDLDERLELINGENYDSQWHWNDNKEMEKDIIEYFGLDTGDKAELNMFFKKVEFDEAGDYVFSGMGECFYTLKDALENEKDNALYTIGTIREHGEETREILETYFDEVNVELLAIVDKEEFDEKLEEFRNEYDGDAYKLTLLHFAESEIKELEKNGWNTDYTEDTIEGCRVCGAFKEKIEIYGFVVKTEEEITPVEEGEMPF